MRVCLLAQNTSILKFRSFMVSCIHDMETWGRLLVTCLCSFVIISDLYF